MADDSVVIVREARAVKYAGILIWSILCRLLLFVLTIAPIGLPILALICLWFFWPTLAGAIGSLGDPNVIARGFSLLSSAGLLSWFITKLGQNAWDQLVEICKAARSVLVEWLPSDWMSLEGLEESWRDYIKNAPKAALGASKRAELLTISLMSGVLLVSLYAIFTPAQTNTPAQPEDPATTVYVAVVDARETNHEIKLFLKSGAVFYLAHVEDAQPKEGEGICLGEPQRKWLDEFRKAIGNCIRAEVPTDNDSKPVFEVRGYASIAPMHAGGDTKVSPELNCKVANWRAAAVADYLANPDEKRSNTRWRCADVKRAFNQVEPNDDECGELYKVPKNPEGNPFLIKVRQWRKPSEMIENKPADDGERPSPRRYDVEIMNRVVRIEVPTDFCRVTPAKLPAP